MHFVKTYSTYKNSEHYTTVQIIHKKRFSRNWHPAAFASFPKQGCTVNDSILHGRLAGIGFNFFDIITQCVM